MMASGSGKNQEDTATKEHVDLLREESTAASTEPPPLAPQSEIAEEEVHGPPEAGGRHQEPSAATAAAAERKGEETMSLFRRGSTGSMPPLLPRPPSLSRARGPSSAGSKPARPPRPMSREVLASGMAMRAKRKRKDVFNERMLECQRSGDQKVEAEGMPRQQNEQVKLPERPKKGKKPLWRKCHFPAQRNVMIVVLLIFSILLLPTKTEAFQHFDNIEDAAQRLAELNNLGDLRLQLEEETLVPTVGFNFRRPIVIAVFSVLLLGLFSRFMDSNQEL